MKSLRLKEGGGWRLEVCFKLHLGLRARVSLEFVSSFLLFFSLPVNYHSLHKFLLSYSQKTSVIISSSSTHL